VRDCCAVYATEIVHTAGDLQCALHKYWGAAKVYAALKYQEIKRLSADLEHSKSSMMLAFQLLAFKTQVRMMGATHDMSTICLLW
jgi:hypothetical protein